MENEINNQEIEDIIVKQFNYMEELKNERRAINAKIREVKSKLDYEESVQKEFNEMLVSLNMGKGKYYAVSTLPYDLKEYMNSQGFKNLDKNEQENIIENYNTAVMRARKQAEKYDFLLEDLKPRKERIKKLRRIILINKKKLYKIEKSYNKNFSNIKKLDKQIKNDSNGNIKIYKKEDIE